MEMFVVMCPYRDGTTFVFLKRALELRSCFGIKICHCNHPHITVVIPALKRLFLQFLICSIKDNYCIDDL